MADKRNRTLIGGAGDGAPALDFSSNMVMDALRAMAGALVHGDYQVPEAVRPTQRYDARSEIVAKKTLPVGEFYTTPERRQAALDMKSKWSERSPFMQFYDYLLGNKWKPSEADFLPLDKPELEAWRNDFDTVQKLSAEGKEIPADLLANAEKYHVMDKALKSFYQGIDAGGKTGDPTLRKQWVGDALNVLTGNEDKAADTSMGWMGSLGNLLSTGLSAVGGVPGAITGITTLYRLINAYQGMKRAQEQNTEQQKSAMALKMARSGVTEGGAAGEQGRAALDGALQRMMLGR